MVGIGNVWRGAAIAAVMSALLGAAHAADDARWTLAKASGEVWVSSEGAQQAALQSDTREAQLKAGDTIRTGGNGRVLLRRGEETMLIAPNSVVGIPVAKAEGMATTIVQQAGSILLEVEKRNVKHFEVETPYLAAVVKGTQFRISVNARGSRVDVLRGQVEVSDFRTGQIAQVMPGQSAMTSAKDGRGLSLSGTGTFAPIEQGKPRATTLQRIAVPRGGLTVPRNGRDTVRVVALGDRSGAPKFVGQAQTGKLAPVAHGLRIAAPLGEVHLNVHKATHGLARDGAGLAHANGHAREGTVWSAEGKPASTGDQSNDNGGSLTAAQSATTGSAASAMANAVAGTVGAANAGGHDTAGGNGNGADNGNANSVAAGNGYGNSGSDAGARGLGNAGAAANSNTALHRRN